jgi:hypothetical protein
MEPLLIRYSTGTRVMLSLMLLIFLVLLLSLVVSLDFGYAVLAILVVTAVIGINLYMVHSPLLRIDDEGVGYRQRRLGFKMVTVRWEQITAVKILTLLNAPAEAELELVSEAVILDQLSLWSRMNLGIMRLFWGKRWRVPLRGLDQPPELLHDMIIEHVRASGGQVPEE